MTLLILQGLTHGGKFVMKEADNTTQKGATKAHQSGQRYLSKLNKNLCTQLRFCASHYLCPCGGSNSMSVLAEEVGSVQLCWFMELQS